MGANTNEATTPRSIIITNMASQLMTSRTHSGIMFPSPEAASPYSEDDDRGSGGGIGHAHPMSDPTAKGWCSERVPLSSYLTRRHVAASALMPFSSGRTLPSKWDDAERWISSPVSVGNAPVYYAPGVAKPVQLPYKRRAKSKSGPLGHAGLTSYGNASFNTYSPVLGMGVINGGKWRNSLTIESPGFARARLGDGLTAFDDGGKGGRRSCPGQPGPEWLEESWSGFSPTDHKERYSGDEDIEGANPNCNGEDGKDGASSRRDMATQMFQESESSSPSSVASSPRSSISTASPHPEPNTNVDNHRSLELEVRDVQVDKQTSTTRRSSPDIDKFNDHPSNSTAREADKEICKEEDRIIAWENLQKAKAEAAIQKLEMKLEKRRLSSMEKIIEKLRRAEIKAQKMRSSQSKGNDQIERHAVAKTTSKLPSFCRKIRLTSSKRSSSTCIPF